jgi:hypothetical protein
MAELIARHPNVRVETGSHGAGWSAAVRRAICRSPPGVVSR